MSSAPTPAQLMEQKCGSSGLGKKTAGKLKLAALTAEQMQKECDKFDCAPAMFIPYFDFDGSTTDFGRYRYLAPPLGFGAALAKPRRYVQLPGSVNEIYMPPLLEKSWRQIAEDSQQELLITEGELKAACACSIGVATLALGGVQMFSRLKDNVELLPQLEEFEWERRSVYIVFDSDAATNPDVQRAQLRLGKVLLDRGALVNIIQMPPNSAGGKQGLDDFIVSQNKEPEAVERLQREHAHPLAAAEALHGMSERVVYITQLDAIGVLATGQIVSPTTFIKTMFAPDKYIEHVPDREGNEKIVVRRTAKEWMEWAGRAEVSAVCYAPGRPRIYNGQFNRWNDWAIKPRKGNLEPWHKLMNHIFAADKSARNWFEQWCAYPLQNPGKKMATCVLMWGAQGSGKTLIALTLGDIYGGPLRDHGPQPENPLARNFNIVAHKDLSDGRAEWAVDKQFILGEEATSADNRRDDAETIKALVTQEQLRVNEKYVKSYTTTDCINYYFTSNHSDSFKLEDDDRRTFVWEMPRELWPAEEFAKYDKWRNEGGAAALFDYLLAVDLTGFNHKGHAPRTSAKNMMITATKSDLAQWVALLKEDPTQALDQLPLPAREKTQLLSVDQLISTYDWEGTRKISKKYMSKELRSAGFELACGGSPARTAKGQQLLFAIRNLEYWRDCRSPKKAAEHWDSMFGQTIRMVRSKAA